MYHHTFTAALAEQRRASLMASAQHSRDYRHAKSVHRRRLRTTFRRAPERWSAPLATALPAHLDAV